MFRIHRFLIAALVLAGTASGGEIYVDNSIGRDGDDGSTTQARDGNTGPVYSLQRAIQLANFGDVIVLANTGEPYYGSISLTGERHSGTKFRPFVIDGNGATISGLRSLPPHSWQNEGSKLWKVTLTRKGYYRLLRDGRVLPETILQGCCVDPRMSLEPGHWIAYQGSLYFRQDGDETPENQAFSYAADQTGISLHQVCHVVIANVTLQHFRFDGLHAQGLCEGIILDNVNAIENGRAGVVSSGASNLDIFGGKIAGNGRYQVLVLDRSTATPHESDTEDLLIESAAQ